MPRYLTQHSLACLTRQGAEALAERMHGAGSTHAERILVNLAEGKMVAEWRAEGRETLEAWLRSEKVHFDWVLRIESEWKEGRWEPAN
jgi:hypothetical protein